MSSAITAPCSESGGATRHRNPGAESVDDGSSARREGLVAAGEITTVPFTRIASQTCWVSADAEGPTMAATPSVPARKLALVTAATERMRVSYSLFWAMSQNTAATGLPSLPFSSAASFTARAMAFSRTMWAGLERSIRLPMTMASL
jgi:hypothetical protein